MQQIKDPEPGFNLDLLIAQWVMEWNLVPFESAKKNPPRPTEYLVTKDESGEVWVRHYMAGDFNRFSPSTDIGDAWKIIEVFSEFSIIKNRHTEKPGYFECSLEDSEGRYITLEAQTAPLAICLAALKLKDIG